MADMYLVGGAVRDRLMGKKTYKDLDFAIVTDSYEDMVTYLTTEWGVEILQEQSQYFRILGKFNTERIFHDYDLNGQVCDFVLCRKESLYSDGRHPDEVGVGSIYDDLARRDFTVNAIAQDINGVFIDPFNGQTDIKSRYLRAVGNAKERLTEDALRVLRAIRFSVTKGFQLDPELVAAMRTVSVLNALNDNISEDRVRKELSKCFAHDAIATLNELAMFPDLRRVIFDGKGINLQPTSGKVNTR